MTLQSSLQSLVYVKSQVAVGTGATITQGGDLALRVRSCEFASVEGTIVRDGTQSATGLPAIAVMGGRHWGITMQVELMRFGDFTDEDSSPHQRSAQGYGRSGGHHVRSGHGLC